MNEGPVCTIVLDFANVAFRGGNHRFEHRRAGVGYRHRLTKTRLSGHDFEARVHP